MRRPSRAFGASLAGVLVLGVLSALSTLGPLAPTAADPGPAPEPGGLFHALAPARLLDTGTGVGAAKALVAAHGAVTFAAIGRGGVPATGVGAVTLEVMAYDASASGFVTAYPAGSPRPAASTLHAIAGRSVSNLVTTRVGAGGEVTVFNGTGAPLRLIADVEGYYTSGSATAPGSTHPMVSPRRFVDTGVGGGGTVSLKATGRGGVPARASAVLLNVTVASARAGGHVTVYPAGQARPTTANVTFGGSHPVASLVLAKVGAGGRVRLHNSSSRSIRLVADIEAYVLGGATSTAGASVAVTPARIADLGRDETPRASIPAHHSIVLTVGGAGGITTYGGQAVWLSLTVPSPSRSGYLTAYRRGSTRPAESSARFVAGHPLTTSVLVRPDSDGYIRVFNGSTRPVDLRADTAGYVVAHAAYHFGWRGESWLGSSGWPGGISCTSATFCLAVSGTALDGAGVERYDGTSWSKPTSLFFGGVDHVACASRSFCLATDLSGKAKRYDGHHWHLVNGPGMRLNGLSCPSATLCLGAGSGGEVYRFNGHAWSHHRVTSSAGVLEQVVCGSTTMCQVQFQDGGTTEYARTYDGSTWSSRVALGDGNAPISCPSSTFCAWISGVGHVKQFDGEHWGDGPDTGFYNVGALSCVSASYCLAGSGTQFVVIHDGATTAPAIDDTVGLIQLVCFSETSCLGVTGDGYTRRWNGASWGGLVRLTPFPGSASDVSCPSTSSCVAVTNLGRVFQMSGTHWGTATSVLPRHAFTAVHCTSAKFCVALTTHDAVTYDGRHWSAPTMIDPAGSLTAVSCTSHTFCVAVDEQGNDVRYDGSQWTTPAPIAGAGHHGTAVSCPVRGQCVAVDVGGYAMTYASGSGWSSATSLPGTVHPEAVSCTTATHCVLVAGEGTSEVLDGTSWSAPVDVSGGAELIDVSCATSTRCLAVSDQAANAYTFDGAVWTATAVAQHTLGPLQRVSCPSSSHCIGVTGGFAVTGRT